MQRESDPAKRTIVPVALAGGGGSRLWPLSRSHYPKQFLEITGKSSFLQQTLCRLPSAEDAGIQAPIVVCNEEHRFLVAEQARQCEKSLSGLLLEPVSRNTAPAMTAAALFAMKEHENPVLVAMPTDHLIAENSVFQQTVVCAARQARNGNLVVLGIKPTEPHTGFGYIGLGNKLTEVSPHIYPVSAFHEKPQLETAKDYLEKGGYLWNAGIFVVCARQWIELVEEYIPKTLENIKKAVQKGQSDGDFFRLEAAHFQHSESISIDHGVMEPFSSLGEAQVIELEAGWSDVGSWKSLWDVSPKDECGNLLKGDVLVYESENNLIYSDQRLVVTLGVKNLAVIETTDSVLVLDKNFSESVKRVFKTLEKAGRDERLLHRRVLRPWGSYETIDAGPGFQVKRISVKQGEALSLQKHSRRAEHWIVVSGEARVTKGKDVFLLRENESTYIPMGVLHRLENATNKPLEIIEVQSGSYLGEDDIVRVDDRYRRS